MIEQNDARSVSAVSLPISWRRLRRDELDHELLWLVVSTLAAALAWGWLHFGLVTPQCTFHTLTGYACPTCGATRAVTQLFHGHLAAALRFNPLVVCALAGVAVFDLYAAAVLLARKPRLRLKALSPSQSQWGRIAVCGAVVLNWAWLVWSGV